jgi:hypothetical protein
MFKIKAKIYIVLVAIALQITGVSVVKADATHAPGTNISSNGTVYFFDGISLRPYTSLGAFTSYGFNTLSNIQIANSADFTIPPGTFVAPMDGSLINDHGTIWVISKGQKLGFTNEAAFIGLGYSYANVIPGDVSFMRTGAYITSASQAHPIDTVISNNGTDYLVTSRGLALIPSQDVFNSWGYAAAKVVPANSFDTAASVQILSQTLPVRPAAQLSAGAYFVDTNFPPACSTTTTGTTANTCNTSTGTTTSTTAPVLNASLAQCGTDTSCMIKNAGTCTLSEGVFSPATDFSNFLITDTDDFQILGLQQNNLCSLQEKVLSELVVYDATGLANAQAKGETAAQIQSDEQGATASQEATVGVITSCTFSPSNLVAYVNDIVTNNYSKEAIDYANGNCSNTVSN